MTAADWQTLVMQRERCRHHIYALVERCAHAFELGRQPKTNAIEEELRRYERDQDALDAWASTHPVAITSVLREANAETGDRPMVSIALVAC